MGNAKRRPRRFVLGVVVAGACGVLVASGWFAWPRVAEEWRIHRYFSGADDERSSALTALIKLRSTRLLDRILDDLVAKGMPPMAERRLVRRRRRGPADVVGGGAVPHREAIHLLGDFAQMYLLSEILTIDDAVRAKWAAELTAVRLTELEDAESSALWLRGLSESIDTRSQSVEPDLVAMHEVFRRGAVAIAGLLVFRNRKSQGQVRIGSSAEAIRLRTFRERSIADSAVTFLHRSFECGGVVAREAFAALAVCAWVSPRMFQAALAAPDRELRELTAKTLVRDAHYYLDELGYEQRQVVIQAAECLRSDPSIAVRKCASQWLLEFVALPPRALAGVAHALVDVDPSIRERSLETLRDLTNYDWRPSAVVTPTETAARLDDAFVRGVIQSAIDEGDASTAHFSRRRLLELGEVVHEVLRSLIASENDSAKRALYLALDERLRAAQCVPK